MRLSQTALVAGIFISTIYLSGQIAVGYELGEVYPPPPQYVDIKNGSFDPSSITVPLNTTVVWSNHNNSTETVTADDGSFDSGNISKNGYEYRYIFLEAGEYGYYSKVHPSMRGSIIVGNDSSQMPSEISGSGKNMTSAADQTASGGSASANATGGSSGKHAPANESKGAASGETTSSKVATSSSKP